MKLLMVGAIKHTVIPMLVVGENSAPLTSYLSAIEQAIKDNPIFTQNWI